MAAVREDALQLVRLQQALSLRSDASRGRNALEKERAIVLGKESRAAAAAAAERSAIE